MLRTVFGKDIGGGGGPAPSKQRERTSVRISRATGPTEFTWDGTYLRNANGQMLYQYSKNELRKVGGPALYVMNGTLVRTAANGQALLETAKGQIKRPTGPTEWMFDGKTLKEFGKPTAWKASGRVPVMVMLKVAGII